MRELNGIKACSHRDETGKRSQTRKVCELTEAQVSSGYTCRCMCVSEILDSLKTLKIYSDWKVKKREN